MKTQTIRVLSVKQPHADLIVLGLKWCENRTWRTTYRGPIFIHASSWDEDTRREYWESGIDIAAASALKCRTGAIIGVAHLGRIHTLAEVESVRGRRRSPDHPELQDLLRQAPRASWEYVTGPECWILTDPAPLAVPLRCKGKLNVWTLDVDAAALAVADQVEP